jgi:hypothetical protein
MLSAPSFAWPRSVLHATCELFSPGSSQSMKNDQRYQYIKVERDLVALEYCKTAERPPRPSVLPFSFPSSPAISSTPNDTSAVP